MEKETTKVSDELKNLIGALKEEGIQKGNEEAGRIVANSKMEAVRIIDEARTDAERIIEDARSNAQNTLKRLETQLDLALRDFMLKAKGELEELIALKPIRESADRAMSDPEFIKKLIWEMIELYKKSEMAHESRHILVTVPGHMRNEFVGEWTRMMREKLDMSMTLHEEEGLLGFKIAFEGKGGIRIMDSTSIVESLKPFISERFQYILERGTLPRE